MNSKMVLGIHVLKVFLYDDETTEFNIGQKQETCLSSSIALIEGASTLCQKQAIECEARKKLLGTVQKMKASPSKSIKYDYQNLELTNMH